MDMSLSKLWEMVKHGEAWHATVHGDAQSRTQLSDWTINREGLPQWLSSKESACNAGVAGSIPESGRFPGGGHGNSLRCSCLENPMDLVGYSPWGHKRVRHYSNLTHRTQCTKTMMMEKSRWGVWKVKCTWQLEAQKMSVSIALWLTGRKGVLSHLRVWTQRRKTPVSQSLFAALASSQLMCSVHVLRGKWMIECQPLTTDQCWWSTCNSHCPDNFISSHGSTFLLLLHD